MRPIVLTALVVALCLAGLGSAWSADASLVIGQVVAERASFDPGAGEKAEWRFRVSRDARVRAAVYDAADRLVRVLADGDVKAGDQRVGWDGSARDGRAALSGYYLLAIEAAAGGDTARWDPTGRTGGRLLEIHAEWDGAAGLVRYALPEPAIVRIHLGLSGTGGALLRTLVDWVARTPGRHAEPWDGMDHSGAVRFASSPDLDVQVWAYSLPVNAVVLNGRSPGVATPAAGVPRVVRAEFLELADPEMRPREEPPRRDMYDHWQHPRDRCHNPVASIEPVGPARRHEDGAVLVEGPLRLGLDLPEDEAEFLQDERFETVIYLDGSFVTEEEQGYFPFTWTLRPEILTPGDHVVTFMLRGYDGHFGSASIRVRRVAEAVASGGKQ